MGVRRWRRQWEVALSPAPPRVQFFVGRVRPPTVCRVCRRTCAGVRISASGGTDFNAKIFNDDRKAVQAAAMKVWDDFKVEYRQSLKHVRTALWDREDLAWELLLRYAAFGGEKNEGSKTGALDYGGPERGVRRAHPGSEGRARQPRAAPRRQREVGRQRLPNPTKGKMENYCTGEPVPDGFKKIPDHVDITLLHSWDSAQKEYVVQMSKFPNKEFKDKIVANLTFGEMALNAFPDSDLANWCDWMPAPRFSRASSANAHEGCYELQTFTPGRKWIKHGRKMYGGVDEIIVLLDQQGWTDNLDNDMVELPQTHGGLTPSGEMNTPLFFEKAQETSARPRWTCFSASTRSSTSNSTRRRPA